eukprot:Nitzschia sp. Nitz4//scaffold14_size191712//8120//21306//NITZ4_001700-RA/size191712-processed-gene-0.39-mRNA-1//-1//CDS//3329536858//4423//frame0
MKRQSTQALLLLILGATLGLDFVAQASAQSSDSYSHDIRQKASFVQLGNRRLAVGDFEDFNLLFEDARIQIPGSFDVSERIAWVRLDMTIWDIECYDIAVGDATLNHARNSNQDIDVEIDIVQLDLKCDLAYKYDYGILSGDGTARVTTDNNSLNTVLGFASPNFNTQAPVSSSVESCTTNIEITNIEFFGDFVSNIVEWFERFIRDTIEKAVEDVACDELGTIGTTFVGSILGVAEETLDMYAGNLDISVANPLYLELTADFPSELRPLDLLDTENTIGQWFNQALDEVDKLFTAVVPDPNGPTDRDLGINVIMRDMLLNENRELVLDVEELGIDPVIFEGHDRLTETSISLTQVKVVGLDTLTTFDPLDRIGHYTLQTAMSWDELQMEFAVHLEIKPSTLEDSVLEGATSDGISEDIVIDFGIDDLDVLLSLFLVIDQDALGSMELGPLLHTNNIASCFVSALHALELCGLQVAPQTINVPTLTGFVSVGIDNILSAAAKAVFAMYEGVLEDTLPKIFQTSIRDFVNSEVIDALVFDDTGRNPCEVTQEPTGYVDFRDLLLSPDEALTMGASGTEPYGDLAYTAMDVVRNNLLSSDSSGLLDLNSFLIEPLTKGQSGESGQLRFPGDLISMEKTSFANEYIHTFVDRFMMGLSNLRVNNLDILKAPVSILGVTSNAHQLSNLLTMGPVDGRPLNLSVGFYMEVSHDGEDTGPLEMIADVDVSISFDSATVEADLLAMVNASKLLHFPLQDILRPSCWLATIPARVLSQAATSLTASEVALSFPSVSMILDSMNIDVLPINTTVNTAALAKVVSTFEASSGLPFFLERLNLFGKELLEGDLIQQVLDESLAHAPKACPHSSEYDPTATGNVVGDTEFPDLSVWTVDSLLYGASLVAEIAWFVFIESEFQATKVPTDPLSVQYTINATESTVDWTNLDGKIGSVAKVAIEQLDKYLDESSEGDNLGVNVLIRDYVLNGTDSMEILFDDAWFELPGVVVSLSSVNIKGLDSFSEFSIWDPIAPQTVLSSFALDSLEFELTVNVMDADTFEWRQGLQISLTMAELRADLAVYLGMNLGTLEALSLGSFMNSDHVLPCLLSAIDHAEISQINFTLGSFPEPRVTGLLPDSLQSIVEITSSMMTQYRDMILETIPTVIDGTLRLVLNDLIATHVSNSECRQVSAPASTGVYVNFDQFFDRNLDVYGDIPSWLLRLVDTELLAVNEETGVPAINDMVIAPFTRKQSGEEGTLVLEGNILTILADKFPQVGIDFADIGFSDAIVSNLDTFSSPLELFGTNDAEPYTIENRLSFSQYPETLDVAMGFHIRVTGDPAFDMDNQLEFSVDFNGTKAEATLLALVDAAALFQYPLGDLANTDCWLATLSKPLLDIFGEVLGNGTSGLSFPSLELVVPNLDLNVVCRNCTSPGFSILPDLMQIVKSDGTLSLLEVKSISLLLELMQTEFVQARINKAILGGTLNCPHHQRYIGDGAISDYPVPEFPLLSFDAIESVAFAATILFHLASVVIAESHSEYDPDNVDPLAGEVSTDGLNLLDFKNLDNTIGTWADSALRELADYIASDTSSSSDSGIVDKRINEILRSSILTDDGLFEFVPDNIGFGGPGAGMFLKNIRILGMDSVKSLQVLDFISEHTSQNQVEWDELSFELTFTMTGVDDARRLSETTEDIVLQVALKNITVGLSLFLALELDVLGSIEIGSILDIESILPCMLTAAKGTKLTQLQAEVGSIDTLTVHGFRSEVIESVVTGMGGTVMEDYGELIRSAIPGILDMTVKAAINNYFDYAVTHAACTQKSALVSTSNSGFVDFRDLFLSPAKSISMGGSGNTQYGDLIRTVYGYLQETVLKVDSSTGLSNVNDLLLSQMTRSQSGEEGNIVFTGDLVNGGTRLSIGGLNANVLFRVSDARINNVDTVGTPLSLLQPTEVSGLVLNNTATIGVSEPLQFGAKVLLSLTGDDDMQLHNEVEISLDLNRATVVADALLKVAADSLVSFPLRDIMDINCWLATIPAPQLDSRGVRIGSESPTATLTEVIASFSSINLNVTCLECSSPRMDEFVAMLSSRDAQTEANEVARNIVEYAVGLLDGNFLQYKIDRALNEAAMKCPHSPSYIADASSADYASFIADTDDDSITFLMLLGGTAIGLCLLVALVMSTIRCYVRHRHRQWVKKLTPEQVQLLEFRQEEEQKKENELNMATSSMFQSPTIPQIVRWTMPLVIIGNIGFFLSGHLSLGATVNIELSFAGEDIVVEKFFEFSMARSTIDIWNAGGHELAILILVFSGIWPYTKQILTLIVWFLPPSRMSVSRRGSLLLWLDWLAKWSMIDIFVLVISIAAFRVSIASPSVGFLPSDFYSVDLLVVPLWGLYANMIAQLISQISSHFIVHYHRGIVKSHISSTDTVSDADVTAPNESESETHEVCERLQDHRFGRPHRAEHEHVVTKNWVNKTLWATSIILSIVVIVGSCIPSFSLKVLGLIGIAVESGQEFEDATVEHTVFSVARLLFEEARFVDSFGSWLGLGTLAVLLISSVLLVPLAQCALLMRQWLISLNQSDRKQMAIYIETLQAWQYAEVYLIAIFVASWQLGPISEFMINSYCGSLKDTFAQWVYFGLIDEEDAQCFSVQSSIKAGSFLLAFGAILLALLNTFVNKATVQYMRDKDRTLQLSAVNMKDIECTSCPDTENRSSELNIMPVPVLFSDTFRWCLKGEHRDDMSRSMSEDESLLFKATSEHIPVSSVENVAAEDAAECRSCQRRMKIFWKRKHSGGEDIREQASPASGRPKLKSAFTEELRESVRNLEKKNEEKRSSRLSRFLGSSDKKEGTKLSPLLSPRLLGGKAKLSLDEPNDEAPRTPDGYETQRPTLDKPLSQGGPPLPFSNQDNENETSRKNEREKEEQARSRRQQIRERQMKRRESKASIMESLHPPESIQEEEEEDLDSENEDEDDTEEFYTSMKVPAKSATYAAPSRPPRISQALADELKQSIHGRDTKNADKRRKIKERIMIRRESQRQELMRSQASFDSFAADEVAAKPAPAPKRGTRKSFADTTHSTDTFQASFSDDSQFQTKGISKDSSSSAMDDTSKDTDDSFFRERFKKQDNKKAQHETTQNNKAMEALQRQVEELKAESKDLRKQLSTWQDKASKSSQRQSQERLKFEASNEMIAKARVDLTKSLNENAMLRRKLYDIEQAGAQKDMKVRSLTGTIDTQAEKVDELALKLRDMEEELRFNVQDKQRLEEELSVLMAAQDGQDIGEVLRRLEQEKATWFEDRERALEAKQIALDEENDRILQRERQKYRQEADDLLELETKSKQREEEQQRLQDAIDKQLKEMREANRDLQEQLQVEHNENRMETKKKDGTISMLEQEVSKLRRKLAASQLREQEHHSRRSEMDSTHEELDIAKKQNRLLEKQIKKLKSDAQSGKGDWREVILPGYKNLRGVTFGSPSDDLAGFLTILVEDQRAKQKQAVSNLQKEIKKYMKEPNAKAPPKKKKVVSKGKGAKVTASKKAPKKTVATKKKTITKSKVKATSKGKVNGKVTKRSKKGEMPKKKSTTKKKKKKEKEPSEAELSNEYDWGEGSSESASEKPKKGNKTAKSKKEKKTSTKKKIKYESKKKEKAGKVSKKRGMDAGGDVYSWENDTTAKQNAAKGGKKSKKKGKITKAKLKSQKRATNRNVSMIESALVGMKPKKAADEVSLVVMKAEHGKWKGGLLQSCVSHGLTDNAHNDDHLNERQHCLSRAVVTINMSETNSDPVKENHEPQEEDDQILIEEAEALNAQLKLLHAAALLRKVRDKQLLQQKHQWILKWADVLEEGMNELLIPPSTEGAKWIKQSEAHGHRDFNVYYHITEDSHLFNRTESIIESSLLVPLLAVFNESELFPTWMPSFKRPIKLGLTSTKKLKEYAIGNQIIQALAKLTWPFKDREVVQHAVAADVIDEEGLIAIQILSQTHEDDPHIPEPSPDVIRVDVACSLTIRGCPPDHPLLEKSKHKYPEGEELMLISFKVFLDAHVGGLPISLINWFSRTIFGTVWSSILDVADGVKHGKRPLHQKKIEENKELYDWIEQRIAVMIEKVKEQSMKHGTSNGEAAVENQ